MATLHSPLLRSLIGSIELETPCSVLGIARIDASKYNPPQTLSLAARRKPAQQTRPITNRERKKNRRFSHFGARSALNRYPRSPRPCRTWHSSPILVSTTSRCRRSTQFWGAPLICERRDGPSPQRSLCGARPSRDYSTSDRCAQPRSRIRRCDGV